MNYKFVLLLRSLQGRFGRRIGPETLQQSRWFQVGLPRQWFNSNKIASSYVLLSWRLDGLAVDTGILGSFGIFGRFFYVLKNF